MAALSDTNRAAIWAEYMRDVDNLAGSVSTLTKAQLRAAVDATDQWNEDNAASFNSALPAAYRNAATAKQKAILQAMVSLKRYGVL